MKKEVNLILGENIRYYREKFGYNREKLSELIEVSPRFLYDVEIGSVGISITTLKRICEVLGVSADRLLWKHENEIVELPERLKHLSPEYLEIVEQLVQKQLEVIAIASKEESRRKTRN